jgi:probable HAF family extracellular repeat protein
MPVQNTYGAALAVNSSLTVVGYFQAVGLHPHCFRWLGAGQAEDLGLIRHGSDCTATAIDEAGRIVGYANVTWHGNPRAFEWENGHFRNLGVLQGGDASVAGATNRSRDVVGWSNLQRGLFIPRHAVLWRGGEMHDIGNDSAYEMTEADAINEAGVIVGVGILQSDQSVHALRFANGIVIPLDSEVQNLGDWQLQYANSINVHGVIVGTGLRADGSHAYMLMPQD